MVETLALRPQGSPQRSTTKARVKTNEVSQVNVESDYVIPPEVLKFMSRSERATYAHK